MVAPGYSCSRSFFFFKSLSRPLILCLFVFSSFALSSQPIIQSVTPLTAQVEKYGKFEARVSVNATYSNPFDYDQVALSVIFTSPDGKQKKVDGFYMIDYTLNKINGSLTQVGNGEFRIRFSPDQAGLWSYVLSVVTPTGTGTYPSQSFNCSAPSSPGNKGFIRSNQTNYLSFDSGDQYIAVGLNMGWQSGNIYTSFNSWLSKLAENGGNFIRLWHAHWGVGIEWQSGNNGFEGLRRYKQSNSFYQDWMFDFCAEKGIYIMLALQHHGQVSSQVNPNWSESPYNVKNGGPCTNTWDFFTNAAAKSHTKNRFRYIMARWGYSRSILTWELFNEVEWTDQFSTYRNDIAKWHFEMAEYLKKNDPYSHLVTTSYAQDNYDAQVWAHPDFDITQTHYYVGTAQLQRVLAAGAQKYLTDFGKPTLNGEFGLNTTGSGLSTLDPNGIHLHNCYWGTLFSGALGTAMTWWWDNYIDPRNLWYHFTPISKVKDEVQFLEKNLIPAVATWTGPTADLEFTPGLGWGALSDSEVTIDANGVMTPSTFSLSTFLYGSQWNTQYRRPPSFHVTMPVAGQFKVKTSGQVGTEPRIAIYLNGNLVLQQAGQIDQTYSIDVPAGKHTIRVDNTGTDWITVASYSISGLGKAVDAYLLKSATKNYAAGWVLNKKYNHQDVVSFGVPAAVSGTVVTIPDMMPGNYTIRFYSPLTGALLKEQAASVANGNLSIALDAFVWDIAFTVDKSPLSTNLVNPAFSFGVYPNPVAAGGQVILDFELNEPGQVSVSLLDMAGREIHIFEKKKLGKGAQEVHLAMPGEVAAGLYWVKVMGEKLLGATALTIIR